MKSRLALFIIGLSLATTGYTRGYDDDDERSPYSHREWDRHGHGHRHNNYQYRPKSYAPREQGMSQPYRSYDDDQQPWSGNRYFR